MAQFAPKTVHWDAAGMLEGLDRAALATSSKALEELEPFFWFDLCAEHDAINLHHHLQRSGVTFSADFWRFEDAWYRDEMNHFRGFDRLYRRFYPHRVADMAPRLERREPQFGPLEPFLEDELRLLVLFAYDELATSQAYYRDLVLYESFGEPVL
ncbi:MAG: hypothetical protein KDB53_15405, partial [Planctomycetes bacterium]|nr:hypothetical protein [Planctomycetota bacterium]